MVNRFHIVTDFQFTIILCALLNEFVDKMLNGIGAAAVLVYLSLGHY